MNDNPLSFRIFSTPESSNCVAQIVRSQLKFFKEFKNIDRETITNILAEMFKAMIVKRWGAEDGFDIIINAERGDLEIWRTRQVR